MLAFKRGMHPVDPMSFAQPLFLSLIQQCPAHDGDFVQRSSMSTKQIIKEIIKETSDETGNSQTVVHAALGCFVILSGKRVLNF